MTFTFTAGLLLRRGIRQELEKVKFMGHDIEVLENKRFLESEFIVKGKPEVIILIGKWIERCAA